MTSSDRSQPHRAQRKRHHSTRFSVTYNSILPVSMIPVYLRSGEASSSSTRRASLPNPPQTQSSEGHTTTRKSVIHDLSGSSSVRRLAWLSHIKNVSICRATSIPIDPLLSLIWEKWLAKTDHPIPAVANEFSKVFLGNRTQGGFWRLWSGSHSLD